MDIPYVFCGTLHDYHDLPMRLDNSIYYSCYVVFKSRFTPYILMLH